MCVAPFLTSLLHCSMHIICGNCICGNWMSIWDLICWSLIGNWLGSGVPILTFYKHHRICDDFRIGAFIHLWFRMRSAPNWPSSTTSSCSLVLFLGGCFSEDFIERYNMSFDLIVRQNRESANISRSFVPYSQIAVVALIW